MKLGKPGHDSAAGPARFALLFTLSMAQFNVVLRLHHRTVALPEPARPDLATPPPPQDATSAPELGAPVYHDLALPSFSPAVHGAGAAIELTSSNQPVVNLYRDIQFLPSSAG